ncbi:uncharacterized protein EV420DRAFT_1558801 [Desarmillaria tabescens]|uniref:Uncharacterized protein n=1 Tax=Armillaria tabescens TaxID=1929756 RepID=A0AA39MZ78_ARMTA|nr:uncharacterized protein EV420DRAFT_1558801 [Desarmillaria tabescens]KAK0452087.1 hypothetical protein EV420DRAFT_1558801 [Desarmillaria tabescens]
MLLPECIFAFILQPFVLSRRTRDHKASLVSSKNPVNRLSYQDIIKPLYDSITIDANTFMTPTGRTNTNTGRIGSIGLDCCQNLRTSPRIPNNGIGLSGIRHPDPSMLWLLRRISELVGLPTESVRYALVVLKKRQWFLLACTSTSPWRVLSEP